MLDTLRMLARYAGGLREFLPHPLTEQECLQMVRHQLDRRQETFLQILEHGVYRNSRSPYRRLLEHAGIRFLDRWWRVRVEGALEEFAGPSPCWPSHRSMYCSRRSNRLAWP